MRLYATLGARYLFSKHVALAGSYNHIYFFDVDTKCILQVKGGPSQTDNEATRKCAITARDSIGPAQISADGAPAPAPAGSAAGSAAPKP